jgi:cation diffusion facilitator family transporter
MAAKRKIPSTRRALLTSFFVDVIDVVTNATVAIVTGSVVMIAETLQGIADMTAVGLLLIGYKRSKKNANKKHPFGFGKEAYFWSLLAGIIILLFTATLSFWFGLQEFMDPDDHIEFVALAYIILTVSVFTNGYAFTVSARKLLSGKSWRSLPREFVRTVHVAPRTTFVLDSMGLLAALFGLTALIVYGVTGDARYDGLGAMAIGLLLALASVVLLTSAKTFITGRGASPEVEEAIKRAAMRVDGVESVLDLKTMMLGHRSVLINLEIHFRDGLVTDDIERLADEVKRRVSRTVDGRAYIQVEPETPRATRR